MLNEILLNLYAQNKISNKKIKDLYETFDEHDKEIFLNDVIFLVIASNPNINSLDKALEYSGYKSTINYYNMLKSQKGSFQGNIFKIKSLKGTPFKQGLVLLLELFKVTYNLKKETCIKSGEKCNHWWHMDLSNLQILSQILQKEFGKTSSEVDEIIEKIEHYLKNAGV